jgi:sugar phosphate isomerase/epimerase
VATAGRDVRVAAARGPWPRNVGWPEQAAGVEATRALLAEIGLAAHDVSLSLELLGPLMFRRARPRPVAPIRPVRCSTLRHMPGEGVIDLVGFFQALQATGRRGGIAPEVIGPRIADGMPPEESARLGLEAARAVLKKAGVA